MSQVLDVPRRVIAVPATVATSSLHPAGCLQTRRTLLGERHALDSHLACRRRPGACLPALCSSSRISSLRCPEAPARCTCDRLRRQRCTPLDVCQRAQHVWATPCSGHTCRRQYDTAGRQCRPLHCDMRLRSPQQAAGPRRACLPCLRPRRSRRRAPTRANGITCDATIRGPAGLLCISWPGACRCQDVPCCRRPDTAPCRACVRADVAAIGPTHPLQEQRNVVIFRQRAQYLWERLQYRTRQLSRDVACPSCEPSSRRGSAKSSFWSTPEAVDCPSIVAGCKSSSTLNHPAMTGTGANASPAPHLPGRLPLPTLLVAQQGSGAQRPLLPEASRTPDFRQRSCSILDAISR